MNLDGLAASTQFRNHGITFEEFRSNPVIASLHWPDDVLEQFLYDHGDNGHFVRDYQDVDLRRVVWGIEEISAEELSEMPTGASETGCIEEYAANPDHWLSVRRPEITRHWETRGTWMRPPILIDRRLLDPQASGLQVLEGRTRVGIIRGRLNQRSLVAPHHQAWIGRPSS
ncbi:hypothetical protein [Streptomyces fagopyri]|uniref:hypothetical protein n=1 Tax=Streptomyces fagopyri TaxID=2662397 RepID=UPI00381BDA4B